VKTLIVKLN